MNPFFSRANVLAVCAAMLTLGAACAIFRPVAVADLVRDERNLTFVDRYGLALGTLLGRDGFEGADVPLERVSPAFVRAIVAAEDSRFMQHGAVDSGSALRAAFEALLGRHVPSGASTISMQLARLVTPVPPGWRGKFAETMLAARLELAFDKSTLLQAYCNRVPMGGNLVGVEAAARAYFGVSSEALDLAQAAFLAAIPNDPVALEPYAHIGATRARQRYVLRRMVADGAADPQDAARAANERLTLRTRTTGIGDAAQFLFWLAPRTPAGETVVRTTIDRELQRFVQTQLRTVISALAGNSVHQGAALVVDNRTGAILAYVGSRDYFAASELGRNDGVQALRQPGSALKPFLYELALERRTVRPTTILLDVPTSYAIPGGKLYAPSDYSGRFAGPVRVRVALANSLNVPAVRVLSRVGVGTFLDRLHALGFAHLARPPGYYGLGLTLGGGEVSLFELVRAYAALLRGGDALELTGDAALERAQPGGEHDPSWALVTSILSDRYARAASFGVNSILALPFPTAVKTGTSSDFRDTWTVGGSRDYTVGVWVGNFDGTPMRHVSGVTGAAPLWNRIMLHLHERHEPAAFANPSGYQRRAICRDTGLKPHGPCPVVQEWLDRADLTAYNAPPPAAPQQIALRITFPHDGDRFVLSGDPRRTDPSQRIDIGIASQRTPVLVTVDGHAVAAARGTFPWALRMGTHEIVAASAGARAHVAFAVMPPPPHRNGFTYAR